ncbi:hypothetical protein FNO01nite_33810 [Flavobacterium noncentrifugens]|uniref:Uncharacterized protein n=1 Tax=Flavobacterium noncentrifugens TaxID=1128970 RepID=A0A1G9DM01_9FLAO|nr:hypothetical protein [Flavobacterium noncentrifugens]GEP52709.1 hypothetical protein FNO01nite_33810 [Flavobacterium noncentrifugens]SDK64597.1 hypothetical protein SAMN04487935_3844 [Flavobacterium noncentrifugens]SDK64928.1 hypothetical protein SAMN04487935_3850 [Flavobacterium noncentrifugens]
MIGYEQILLSSIGGSAMTLFINELIKSYNKTQKLKRSSEIFVQFIDDIIIKYLKKNILGYDDLLNVKSDEEYFKSRNVTLSPMLNKNIFDFFEKEDLIKISSEFKQKTIVDIYHAFYEIDFLQEHSHWRIIEKFRLKMKNHYEKHKKDNESFLEHIEWCQNFQGAKSDLVSELKMQKKHCEVLIKDFEIIKKEILQNDIMID